MPTVLVYPGRMFEVRGWGASEDECEVKIFLLSLLSDIPREHKRLNILIERMANQGQAALNERHCLELEGGPAERLFRFKAPGGSEILWFFAKSAIIVCTHGFVNKRSKTPPEEIKHAQGVRSEYFREQCETKSEET